MTRRDGLAEMRRMIARGMHDDDEVLRQVRQLASLQGGVQNPYRSFTILDVQAQRKKVQKEQRQAGNANDTGLAAVNKAWARLSADQKRAILAVIDGRP